MRLGIDPIVTIERVATSLKGMIDEKLLAARQELYMTCQEIMLEAKTLTPVDTGNLKASGHVQFDDSQEGKFTVTMGFGGPAGTGNMGETNQSRRVKIGNKVIDISGDVGYALPVHEDLDAYHKVGQPKYLEDPWRGWQPEIVPRIKKAMDAA